MDRVLQAGERLALVVAGNHCQGAMFRDGEHLNTAELEQSVDAIARRFEGFYFGRFDVRYSDPALFRLGRGFRIVELNGVTSEATNIYDPARSLGSAYRTLARQWKILYTIGALNRDRGHVPAALGDVIRAVRDHYRGRRVNPLSD
jgi:hypothetical protein